MQIVRNDTCAPSLSSLAFMPNIDAMKLTGSYKMVIRTELWYVVSKWRTYKYDGDNSER